MNDFNVDTITAKELQKLIFNTVNNRFKSEFKQRFSYEIQADIPYYINKELVEYLKTQLKDYPENPQSVSDMKEYITAFNDNSEKMVRLQKLTEYFEHWQDVMIGAELI